ncbi:hypothetical protein SUGI_0860770 [Cryptomeria japonica]|nr:hypothetical protein SUGI_0860770 [Cryptomeria japonica]
MEKSLPLPFPIACLPHCNVPKTDALFLDLTQLNGFLRWDKDPLITRITPSLHHIKRSFPTQFHLDLVLRQGQSLLLFPFPPGPPVPSYVVVRPTNPSPRSVARLARTPVRPFTRPSTRLVHPSASSLTRPPVHLACPPVRIVHPSTCSLGLSTRPPGPSTCSLGPSARSAVLQCGTSFFFSEHII